MVFLFKVLSKNTFKDSYSQECESNLNFEGMISLTNSSILLHRIANECKHLSVTVGTAVLIYSKNRPGIMIGCGLCNNHVGL